MGGSGLYPRLAANLKPSSSRLKTAPTTNMACCHRLNFLKRRNFLLNQTAQLPRPAVRGGTPETAKRRITAGIAQAKPVYPTTLRASSAWALHQI